MRAFRPPARVSRAACPISGSSGFWCSTRPTSGTALRNLERYLHLHVRGAAPRLSVRGRSGGPRLRNPGARRRGPRTGRGRGDGLRIAISCVRFAAPTGSRARRTSPTAGRTTRDRSRVSSAPRCASTPGERDRVSGRLAEPSFAGGGRRSAAAAAKTDRCARRKQGANLPGQGQEASSGPPS